MRQQRKISRDEWAAIAARHATGESLASIGRVYDCTAPAIRYILRQARKSDPALMPDQTIPSAVQPLDADLAGDERRRAEPASGSGRGAKGQAGSNQRAVFDPSLREAMTLEISAFLVAFDAVVVGGTPEAFDRLRGATDRLMRAAARVRIELERKR